MGGGVYGFLQVDGGNNIKLYDLSDGRRRTFRGPEGGGVTDDPLYITSDEMVVMGVFEGRSTLFRVQLASLPYE